MFGVHLGYLSLKFFFFMNKEKYIKRKEAHQRSTPKYTGSIERREKRTLNQGLTNLQNLQRKGDKSQKNPYIPGPQITKEK